jgi:ACS family hexuronate transporter-like MFS transporter
MMPRPRGNFRWVICALLFFACVVNYMDRQILGLLKPTLSKELNWSETDYGRIAIAFQASYAIGQVLFGPFIEWIGTKSAYAFSMVLWSLAAMAHALARSVFGFSTARFALGLGESGNFPIAIKTVAEWFPPKERSVATGIFNAGSNIGPSLPRCLCRGCIWLSAGKCRLLRSACPALCGLSFGGSFTTRRKSLVE